MGVEAGGEAVGDDAGGGAAATVGPAGGGSLLTVAIVVMFAALVTADAGVSCRLSEGSGDREAVYMTTHQEMVEPGCLSKARY